LARVVERLIRIIAKRADEHPMVKVGEKRERRREIGTRRVVSHRVGLSSEDDVSVDGL